MSAGAALYLVPVPLAEDARPEEGLPAPAIGRVRGLRDFVVENARSARRFLSACGHPGPIASLNLSVLDEHTPASQVGALLAPLRDGRDLGLLSEAGAPAVADPGARLVAAAHEYLARLPGSPACRFDAVLLDGLDAKRVVWVRDAFDAGG